MIWAAWKPKFLSQPILQGIAGKKTVQFLLIYFEKSFAKFDLASACLDNKVFTIVQIQGNW